MEIIVCGCNSFQMMFDFAIVVSFLELNEQQLIFCCRILGKEHYFDDLVRM